MARRKIDMTGKEIGKLKVLKYIETKNGQAYWLCRCSCGKEIIARGSHLRSGSVKSCGCLRTDENKSRAKHNKSRNRIYNIYYGMRKRCYISSHKFYKEYGERGIKVCDEWMEPETGFNSFYAWAIKNGYKDNLTLDRIDTNQNYSPQNCRWVSMKIQCNNRRNTTYITYKGKTLTPTQWEEECGIPRQTILKRYKKGLSIESVFDNSYWKKKGVI